LPGQVIDVATGEVLDHAPELLLSRQTAVPWSAPAETPRLDDILRQAFNGDQERAGLFWALAGRSLVRAGSRPLLVLLHGNLQTAGCLVRLLAGVLGSYAAAVPPADIVLRAQPGSLSRQFDSAKQAGTRIAWACQAWTRFYGYERGNGAEVGIQLDMARVAQVLGPPGPALWLAWNLGGLGDADLPLWDVASIEVGPYRDPLPAVDELVAVEGTSILRRIIHGLGLIGPLNLGGALALAAVRGLLSV